MSRLRRVFTYIALLGGLSFFWLFVVTEKLRVKSYSSQDFMENISAATDHSKRPKSAFTMPSRQDERKRQISSYCKKTKSISMLQPSLLKHLIVDNKHRIVYCYIPKVACTTWKTIMVHLLGKRSHKSVHHQRFNLLSFYSKTEARYILDNYYKFMFVREPFERLLSAYKDKFTRKGNDVYRKYERKIRRSVGERLGANAEDQEIKFSDFILYLINVNSKGGRYNEHWQHFDKLCRPCQINYDFIGHYETLEEDARFVLHEAGVDKIVSFPPVRFTGTKDELERYYSEIPRENVLQLQRIYKSDFQMFGYKALHLGDINRIVN